MTYCLITLMVISLLVSYYYIKIFRNLEKSLTAIENQLTSINSFISDNNKKHTNNIQLLNENNFRKNSDPVVDYDF